MENIQLSLFGRMYPELFQVTTERILEPCLKKSQTPIFQCLQVANGQPQEWLEGERLTPLGESLMLNIGEYPSVENESTLSEILEDNVPEKYYLSPKACLGILRRAKNKGRKLPDNLRIALEQKVAEGGEVLGLDFAHADSVVRTYKDITPTLVQNMGRGGGQTPCIMYEQRTIAIDQGGGKSQCGITTELSPTLTCTHGGEPVIYSEKRNVIPLRDEVTRNKASNGLGVGKVGGPCPTLTTADIHSVFYEAYQHHGYRESDTSGTLTAGQNNTVRVLAYGEKTGRRNILHIMNRERIGQVRGVPFLAPVIDTIKQLGRYTEAEVLAAVINGLFTVFIEKESASDDVPFGESIPEEMQVDQEDENSIELAPGAVIDLGEGEKANMVNPGRPNPNFDPFVIAVLKQIGAALEIPYEILIMAFSSNYSASRAAILEFFKVVKMYRAWFVADFCQPIYEEWLSEAVAKGRIKAPGFFTDPIIKDAYCSAEWTGPSAGQLDPTKEVEAAEKRVQGGYSTREREARELTGTDFYKNIKQRKREEELLKEVTGGAKTDTQTVENINGREESDTENNPDNDGGQTEEETEE